MADVLAPAVVGGDVPALRSVGEAVGLDLALGELVLVLLVVVDREHAAALDRLVHLARDVGVVAARGRDLQPLLRGIVAERRDDLLAGADEPALRQVVAEQVDRRDQRLGLERQQPRGPGEVVAVGLGVDLDLVALQLGVEHVGPAAEVDDVEQVDVVAELLVADVEPLLARRPPAAGPRPSRTRSASRRGSPGGRSARAGSRTRSARWSGPNAAPAAPSGPFRPARSRRCGAVRAAPGAPPPRRPARAGRARSRCVASAGPRRPSGGWRRTRSRRSGPCRAIRRRGRDCGTHRRRRSRAPPARRSGRAGRSSRSPGSRRAATRRGGRSRGGRSPPGGAKSCSAFDA